MQRAQLQQVARPRGRAEQACNDDYDPYPYERLSNVHPVSNQAHSGRTDNGMHVLHRCLIFFCLRDTHTGSLSPSAKEGIDTSLCKAEGGMLLTPSSEGGKSQDELL